MKPLLLIIATALAACSSGETPGNESAITFAKPDGNAAAPISRPANEALAPEAKPASEPAPVETGPPPPWAGRYAASAGECAAKTWTFSGAAIRPPDGRLCRIGQTSTPRAGHVTLLLRCDAKGGATNEVWEMETGGAALTIARDNAGVKDRISLSKC